MTPTRWRRVQDLVNTALDLPESDRQAFIDDVCGSNAALRRQIEDLVSSYEQAGNFLERAVEAGVVSVLASSNVSPGDRLGAYELVEAIGEGGMGTVYRAVRADDQFRQQVAIKIIRSGFGATPELLARFRAERQILATLSHPNIARLLDGGVTSTGLPYLVMEYIEGSPIDRFVVAKSLSIRERLLLFLPLCSAVQYAHQNLIVHRDIKPANVLVTTDGTPKLLDFGIAKLLQADALGQTLIQTREAERLMTPEYASPEQVRGDPISTAADIYSLGVLLYELLTGSRPFDFGGMSISQYQRAICEVDPKRPSLATKASHELSGDLDAIVMKALRKEPARRYSSAEQLKDDVECYLKGLPVNARAGAWTYRAGKFIRRRKLALSITAIAAVLIAGSGIGTLLEARRAENALAQSHRQLETALQMANSSLFEIHDSVAKLPGSTKAKALIVDRAVQSLARLQKNGGSGVELRTELAAAYEKLSETQYRDGPGNLGASKAAEASAEEALTLRQALAANKPNDLAAQAAIATDLVRLADIYRLTVRDQDAVREYREAVKIYEQIVSSPRATSPMRAYLADARQNLATGLAELEDGKGAIDQVEQAIRLRQEILAVNPNDPEAQRGIEQAWLTRGSIQTTLLADYPGSAESLTRALEIARGLSARFPHQNSYRTDVASVLSSLGNNWFTAKDPARALPFYRESLSIIEALAIADPADARTRRSVGIHSTNLALALQGTKQFAEAEQLYRRSITVQEALVQQDPESPQHPYDLAFVRAALGRLLIQSKRADEGIHELEAAAQINEGLLVGSDARTVRYRPRLASIYQSLGDALATNHDVKPARAAYERGLEVIREAPAQNRQAQKSLTERLQKLNAAH